MKLLHLIPILIISNIANAQLSPPGLGDTRSAYWSAVGIRQKLNEKNTSVTYIGSGRISGPENGDPLQKPSILVLNEEMYHALNPNWQYSYAFSYRRQDHYSYNAGFNANDEIHQEYRSYGRISNSLKFGNFKWKNTLRQEIRKFFTTDFREVENSLQLRTRIKTQLYAGLDNDKTTGVTLSAEALLSIKHDAAESWSNYGYQESRFCLYYTYRPKELPVTFDLGYMNNLIGSAEDVIDANYIAFDIIVENPF